MNSSPNRLDVTAEVLNALGRPAVILDEVNLMVRATEQAEELGFGQNRPLIELELLNLVDWARKSANSESFEGPINLGTRSAKNWVLATATPIGEGLVVLFIEDRAEARRLDETLSLIHI